MDRRRFLAAGGLVAASPVLAQAVATDASADTTSGLFKQVNFTSDGLALDPREYATLLLKAATAGPLEPDDYSLGGAVATLERKFAQLLGKEAAMFVPTGTLANHLAVRRLAGNDRRVLVQAESHLYNDSGDGAQILSGLNLIPLAPGHGTIELSEVKRWIERTAGGRVETRIGVLSIETPVRRLNHEMFEPGELARVCGYAREQGIRLHLDGARMFNLPFHSGKSVRDHAALFDTVYVSLWKHFNASSGAILAGDADFIDGMFHMRRMFGGALPQAWPDMAVAARHADAYEDEYARAWQAADQWIALLEADGRFQTQRIPNGTSRFFLTVSGQSPDVLRERVSRHGIVLPRARSGTGTFPLQVNATLLRTTPAALAKIFIDAMA